MACLDREQARCRWWLILSGYLYMLAYFKAFGDTTEFLISFQLEEIALLQITHTNINSGRVKLRMELMAEKLFGWLC